MRVLLIEDEHKFSGFMQRELVADGYLAEVASDGPSGLEMATSRQFDIIVLDLMLPGMDGAEVLRRLRNTNCSVPVLIVSARSAVQDKVAAIEAGADDYLIKPFMFPELLVRIKALMRREPIYRPNLIQVSDLELDRLSRNVKRGGNSIELTPTEYVLLEYLMSNAGS